MKLRLSDNYQIETDTLNYILQKISIRQKGKNKGKEIVSNIGYYGKIEHLLNALLEHKIKGLDAKDIHSLQAQIAGLKDFIKEQGELIEEQLKGAKM